MTDNRATLAVIKWLSSDLVRCKEILNTSGGIIKGLKGKEKKCGWGRIWGVSCPKADICMPNMMAEIIKAMKTSQEYDRRIARKLYSMNIRCGSLRMLAHIIPLPCRLDNFILLLVFFYFNPTLNVFFKLINQIYYTFNIWNYENVRHAIRIYVQIYPTQNPFALFCAQSQASFSCFLL